MAAGKWARTGRKDEKNIATFPNNSLSPPLSISCKTLMAQESISMLVDVAGAWWDGPARAD
jgi:hypothetical protein